MVECRVSILGTTIMNWVRVPHNSTYDPFGQWLGVLLVWIFGFQSGGFRLSQLSGFRVVGLKVCYLFVRKGI